MRTDLDKECAPCGLRLPTTERSCPRCAGELGPAAREPAKHRWIDRLRGGPLVHPVRDLLLYVPAAVGCLLAPAVVLVAFELPPHPFQDGMTVGLTAIGLAGGTCGLALGVAVLWLPWAALLALVSGLFNVLRGPPVRLRAVPLPALERPARFERWVPDLRPFPMGKYAHVEKSDLVGPAIAIGLTWTAQVVTEIAARIGAGAGADRSPGPLPALAIALGFTALSWVFVWYPTSLLLTAAASLARRIARAIAALIGARKEAASWHGTPDLAALQAARSHVTGSAKPSEGSGVTAPLSGRACLAFRLVGRVGDLTLDDAEAAPFVVVHDEVPTTVRGGRWVVALPVDPPSPYTLDDGQRTRLASFLEPRVRRATLERVALSESRLEDGDAVDVWAAREAEAAQGAYRGEAPGGVALADGDGKPVVLARAGLRGSA